jgi:hypothetical protein
VHLVAGWTEDDEVADVIVAALTVDMAHLQDVGDAEAAMGADRRIFLECQLAIIDAFHKAQRCCPLTSQISDPAPLPFAMQLKRYRRVRWICFVGLPSVHSIIVGTN